MDHCPTARAAMLFAPAVFAFALPFCPTVYPVISIG
jgi:hypothetical protein